MGKNPRTSRFQHLVIKVGPQRDIRASNRDRPWGTWRKVGHWWPHIHVCVLTWHTGTQHFPLLQPGRGKNQRELPHCKGQTTLSIRWVTTGQVGQGALWRSLRGNCLLLQGPSYIGIYERLFRPHVPGSHTAIPLEMQSGSRAQGPSLGLNWFPFHLPAQGVFLLPWGKTVLFLLLLLCIFCLYS